MPFQRYGGGSGGGNYGSNRGYSSGSGVSPWQMGGQPASGSKVDPLALMGTIMGAMMGGGGGQAQHLAGLTMANAMNTGGAPDRGYDRDRRERQVMWDCTLHWCCNLLMSTMILTTWIILHSLVVLIPLLDIIILMNSHLLLYRE